MQRIFPNFLVKNYRHLNWTKILILYLNNIKTILFDDVLDFPYYLKTANEPSRGG